jgi:hypothetical protein
VAAKHRAALRTIEQRIDLYIRQARLGRNA